MESENPSGGRLANLNGTWKWAITVLLSLASIVSLAAVAGSKHSEALGKIDGNTAEIVHCASSIEEIKEDVKAMNQGLTQDVQDLKVKIAEIKTLLEK